MSQIRLTFGLDEPSSEIPSAFQNNAEFLLDSGQQNNENRFTLTVDTDKLEADASYAKRFLPVWQNFLNFESSQKITGIDNQENNQIEKLDEILAETYPVKYAALGLGLVSIKLIKIKNQGMSQDDISKRTASYSLNIGSQSVTALLHVEYSGSPKLDFNIDNTRLSFLTTAGQPIAIALPKCTATQNKKTITIAWGDILQVSIPIVDGSNHSKYSLDIEKAKWEFGEDFSSLFSPREAESPSKSPPRLPIPVETDFEMQSNGTEGRLILTLSTHDEDSHVEITAPLTADGEAGWNAVQATFVASDGTRNPLTVDPNTLEVKMTDGTVVATIDRENFKASYDSNAWMTIDSPDLPAVIPSPDPETADVTQTADTAPPAAAAAVAASTPIPPTLEPDTSYDGDVEVRVDGTAARLVLDASAGGTATGDSGYTDILYALATQTDHEYLATLTCAGKTMTGTVRWDSGFLVFDARVEDGTGSIFTLNLDDGNIVLTDAGGAFQNVQPSSSNQNTTEPAEIVPATEEAPQTHASTTTAQIALENTPADSKATSADPTAPSVVSDTEHSSAGHTPAPAKESAPGTGTQTPSLAELLRRVGGRSGTSTAEPIFLDSNPGSLVVSETLVPVTGQQNAFEHRLTLKDGRVIHIFLHYKRTASQIKIQATSAYLTNTDGTRSQAFIISSDSNTNCRINLKPLFNCSLSFTYESVDKRSIKISLRTYQTHTKHAKPREFSIPPDSDFVPQPKPAAPAEPATPTTHADPSIEIQNPAVSADETAGENSGPAATPLPVEAAEIGSSPALDLNANATPSVLFVKSGDLTSNGYELTLTFAFSESPDGTRTYYPDQFEADAYQAGQGGNQVATAVMSDGSIRVGAATGTGQHRYFWVNPDGTIESGVRMAPSGVTVARVVFTPEMPTPAPPPPPRPASEQPDSSNAPQATSVEQVDDLQSYRIRGGRHTGSFPTHFENLRIEYDFPAYVSEVKADNIREFVQVYNADGQPLDFKFEITQRPIRIIIRPENTSVFFEFSLTKNRGEKFWTFRLIARKPTQTPLSPVVRPEDRLTEKLPPEQNVRLDTRVTGNEADETGLVRRTRGETEYRGFRIAYDLPEHLTDAYAADVQRDVRITRADGTAVRFRVVVTGTPCYVLLYPEGAAFYLQFGVSHVERWTLALDAFALDEPCIVTNADWHPSPARTAAATSPVSEERPQAPRGDVPPNADSPWIRHTGATDTQSNDSSSNAPTPVPTSAGDQAATSNTGSVEVILLPYVPPAEGTQPSRRVRVALGLNGQVPSSSSDGRVRYPTMGEQEARMVGPAYSRRQPTVWPVAGAVLNGMNWRTSSQSQAPGSPIDTARADLIADQASGSPTLPAVSGTSIVGNAAQEDQSPAASATQFVDDKSLQSQSSTTDPMLFNRSPSTETASSEPAPVPSTQNLPESEASNTKTDSTLYKRDPDVKKEHLTRAIGVRDEAHGLTLRIVGEYDNGTRDTANRKIVHYKLIGLKTVRADRIVSEVRPGRSPSLIVTPVANLYCVTLPNNNGYAYYDIQVIGDGVLQVEFLRIGTAPPTVPASEKPAASPQPDLQEPTQHENTPSTPPAPPEPTQSEPLSEPTSTVPDRVASELPSPELSQPADSAETEPALETKGRDEADPRSSPVAGHNDEADGLLHPPKEAAPAEGPAPAQDSAAAPSSLTDLVTEDSKASTSPRFTFKPDDKALPTRLSIDQTLVLDDGTELGLSGEVDVEVTGVGKARKNHLRGSRLTLTINGEAVPLEGLTYAMDRSTPIIEFGVNGTRYELRFRILTYEKAVFSATLGRAVPRSGPPRRPARQAVADSAPAARDGGELPIAPGASAPSDAPDGGELPIASGASAPSDAPDGSELPIASGASAPSDAPDVGEPPIASSASAPSDAPEGVRPPATPTPPPPVPGAGVPQLSGEVVESIRWVIKTLANNPPSALRSILLRLGVSLRGENRAAALAELNFWQSFVDRFSTRPLPTEPDFYAFFLDRISSDGLDQARRILDALPDSSFESLSRFEHATELLLNVWERSPGHLGQMSDLLREIPDYDWDMANESLDLAIVNPERSLLQTYRFIEAVASAYGMDASQRRQLWAAITGDTPDAATLQSRLQTLENGLRLDGETRTAFGALLRQSPAQICENLDVMSGIISSLIVDQSGYTDAINPEAIDPQDWIRLVIDFLRHLQTMSLEDALAALELKTDRRLLSALVGQLCKNNVMSPNYWRLMLATLRRFHLSPELVNSAKASTSSLVAGVGTGMAFGIITAYLLALAEGRTGEPFPAWFKGIAQVPGAALSNAISEQVEFRLSARMSATAATALEEWTFIGSLTRFTKAAPGAFAGAESVGLILKAAGVDAEEHPIAITGAKLGGGAAGVWATRGLMAGRMATPVGIATLFVQFVILPELEEAERETKMYENLASAFAEHDLNPYLARLEGTRTWNHDSLLKMLTEMDMERGGGIPNMALLQYAALMAGFTREESVSETPGKPCTVDLRTAAEWREWQSVVFVPNITQLLESPYGSASDKAAIVALTVMSLNQRLDKSARHELELALAQYPEIETAYRNFSNALLGPKEPQHLPPRQQKVTQTSKVVTKATCTVKEANTFDFSSEFLIKEEQDQKPSPIQMYLDPLYTPVFLIPESPEDLNKNS